MQSARNETAISVMHDWFSEQCAHTGARQGFANVESLNPRMQDLLPSILVFAVVSGVLLR